MDKIAKEVDALLTAGAMLANCAFNLAQSSKLDEYQRRSLDESRKAWDAALSDFPATLRQQAARVDEASTQRYVLKAMAANYGDGPHIWDKLDREVCEKAAEEIKALRAALAQNTQGVMVDFAGMGSAGPFEVRDGTIHLPEITINDLQDRIRDTHGQNTQGEAAGCAEGKFTAEQYEARALELRNERLGPHWSKDAEMMEQAASLIRDQSKIVDAEPVEFDYPDFHVQGMGCGLEDRGITDRYEAMRYGWDDALDQMARIIDSMGPLYTHAERARVPEGMVLVPREPTKDQLRDGAYQVSGLTHSGAEWVYQAQLAAAPSQPKDAGEVGHG